MSLNAIGCKMLLSSSQELHSRTYFAEWPSHCPQQTLDTDALRSGSEAAAPLVTPVPWPGRVPLVSSSVLPDVGRDESGARLTSDNSVTPLSPCVGAMTLTGPDCQVSAILSGQTEPGSEASQAQLACSHAPTLCTPVHCLYTPCSLSGSALTDCSQYYHLAPYITDPET